VGEEVGRRLRGLLDGDDVAIPRDGASEVSYDFASVQGRWWIGCKGEEQRDGGRGWELHHPQRTIVTYGGGRVFAGVSATGAHVAVQGCSVYEFDAVNSKITGGRMYFDVTTLLKQISAA
jgi:hypothetical protein